MYAMILEYRSTTLHDLRCSCEPTYITIVTLCPGTFVPFLGFFDAAFGVTCTQSTKSNPYNTVSFSCLVLAPILSHFILPKFATTEQAQKMTYVSTIHMLSTIPPQYPCLQLERPNLCVRSLSIDPPFYCFLYLYL